MLFTRAVLPLVVAVLVASAFGGVTPVAAASDHPPDAPTHLAVDDDAAPLAVAGDPAFGWVVNDPDRGERQSAYEIVVQSVDGTTKHPVVDTGEVHAPDQSYVHIAGLERGLVPDHRYAWTVRTWDSAGKAGPYAPTAQFDTALGDGDWHAQWIRRPGAERAALEDYSLFRRDVTVGASPVVRAVVAASAGHHYELRVNGVRRAIGPSYAYPDEQYSETTDVTGDVVAGKPATFAFVTWWGQPGQGRPASVPAFIAHITIDHADGTRQIVTTDGTWRTHAGPWVQDVVRNDEGDFVEHVDERRDPVGWDRSGFDDRSWPRAAVVGPHPVAPFTHLVPARTHIVEQRVAPQHVRSVGSVPVADFGTIISATPVVHLAHATAGTPVVLVAGDALDTNGRVSRTQGTQDTNMTWRFDTRSGPQDLRPFGYLAFRYLEVDGAGSGVAPSIAVDARHASLPDEHAATFATSNPTLDAVWNLARHSALYDVQEQFVDTPTREKGPFLGDSFDVSQATMAAFGERASTAQALRDFARSQRRYWPDGRVNVVYPNGDGKRDIPDATETYPEWVWRYWMTTGDRDTLASSYPTVANIVAYVGRAIDPRTGLVTNLPGGTGDSGYQYGAVDWPPWMRYGYDMGTSARTMINVYAIDDFRRAAALATALGRTDDARTDTARADALATAVRAHLERPDGIFIDGLEPDGSRSAHASEQANAWALAYDVVPAQSRARVANFLAATGSRMGVVYYRVLLDALHSAGRDDALVGVLTDPRQPGYAQILRRGATFTWESWIAPEIGDSESHGWGSTVLAVLQDDILGVRATAPGGAALDIRVPATTLTNATGVVATQRGPVPIHWTRDAAGRERIDVTVPANVVAHITIPARNVAGVSDDGYPVTDAPGIERADTGAGGVVLTVGSGRYVLENAAPVRARRTASDSSTTTAVVLLVALGILVLATAAAAIWLGRRRRAASR